MKVAFFDTKPYDRLSFEKKESDLKFKFFETKLSEDTVDLARGYDAVCVFVNDVVNAAVIDRLHELGVKVIALRCAGFNNVDMKHAFGKNSRIACSCVFSLCGCRARYGNASDIYPPYS